MGEKNEWWLARHEEGRDATPEELEHAHHLLANLTHYVHGRAYEREDKQRIVSAIRRAARINVREVKSPPFTFED